VVVPESFEVHPALNIAKRVIHKSMNIRFIVVCFFDHFQRGTMPSPDMTESFLLIVSLSFPEICPWTG
jgi:hypothetical protein